MKIKTKFITKTSFFMRFLIKKLYTAFVAFPMRVFPVQNMVIFESHSDLCDNSKAIYNRMRELNIAIEYKLCWFIYDKKTIIPRDHTDTKFIYLISHSTSSRIINELKSTYYLTICKYYFFTHRNHARNKPRRKQVFFNLTHGTPLKDSTGLHPDYKKSTHILSTSEFAAKLRVETYGGGQDRVAILGFPRNDFFFEKANVLNRLGIQKNEFKKIIMWMPTFRRQKESDRNDSGTKNISDIPIIQNISDWEVLNRVLEENKVLLILKPHPAQDMRYIQEINYQNIKLITNDMLLEKGIELYQLIGESDALITDYSSVYMDYLTLNRPIGFTVDDIEQYSDNLGFLVENPLDYMPGMQIKNIEDLSVFLKTIDIDDFKVERNKIKKLFNKYDDGNSSDRILKFLGFRVQTNIHEGK